MQFVKPQLFQEAVAKLGGRTPIGAALSSKEWRDVPLALRERAFFSAKVQDARFLSDGKSFLGDFLQRTVMTLPNGEKALKIGGRAQFIETMQQYALAVGMEPLDPKDRGGLKDITSEKRLALVFDTNIKSAQDFGYWQQGQDPDLLDAFPAQRFIRVHDVKKPRPYHDAALGTVRLKSDVAFWISLNRDFGVPWGPWGYYSGCDVEDVDREEAESLKLLSPGEKVEPVEKDFNDGLQASVKGMDPAVLAKLKGQFGGQAAITGDTIRWLGGAEDDDFLRPAADPAEDAPDEPEPAAQPMPVAPPRRAPVSASVRVDKKMRAPAKRAVARALNAMSVAHDDGNLRRINVDGRTDSRAWGEFEPGQGNAPDRIGLRRDSPRPTYTAVHEFAHPIDARLFGDGRYASETSAELAELRAAFQASARHAEIAADDALGPMIRSERLSAFESFARAYVQWVTQRSGDPVLLAELASLRRSVEGWKVWDDDDFAPIARALDNLFAGRKLLS